MAIEIDTPVAAVEGIGPATAARLAEAGIHTVCDLLRVNRSQVLQAVGSLASEDEVTSWRRMAALMQVAEVTPQWAEALVRGGIDAIDELHRQRLDHLDAVFREAVDRGTVPGAPALPLVAEMLKDAGVLRFTGAMIGTVLGAAGQGLANATLRIVGREHRTDDRGRFRILRIPLGSSWPLHIEHPDFATLTVEAPAIAADSTVVGGSVFTLQAATAAPSPQPVLSELAGDALPAWDRARSVALVPPELREGDVLQFRQLYASAPEAGLVSLLKAWQDGELLVFTLRVPLSVVPAGAKLNDQFRVEQGALVGVAWTPLELHRYRIDLRVRAASAGRPLPASNQEWAALLREQFQLRASLGYYIRRRT